MHFSTLSAFHNSFWRYHSYITTRALLFDGSFLQRTLLVDGSFLQCTLLVNGLILLMYIFCRDGLVVILIMMRGGAVEGDVEEEVPLLLVSSQV